MTRVFDVWEELFDLKLGDLSVAEYYSKFTTVSQSLDSFLHPSTDSKVLTQRQENMCVILFLKGLGSEHTSLRLQITSQSTLATIDEAFSRL